MIYLSLKCLSKRVLRGLSSSKKVLQYPNMSEGNISLKLPLLLYSSSASLIITFSFPFGFKLFTYVANAFPLAIENDRSKSYSLSTLLLFFFFFGISLGKLSNLINYYDAFYLKSFSVGRQSMLIIPARLNKSEITLDFIL